MPWTNPPAVQPSTSPEHFRQTFDIAAAHQRRRSIMQKGFLKRRWTSQPGTRVLFALQATNVEDKAKHCMSSPTHYLHYASYPSETTLRMTSMGKSPCRIACQVRKRRRYTLRQISKASAFHATFVGHSVKQRSKAITPQPRYALCRQRQRYSWHP